MKEAEDPRPPQAEVEGNARAENPKPLPLIEKAYTYKKVCTDEEAFFEFHKLLMQAAPEGYTPFYFRCAANSKDPYLKAGSWLKNPLTVEEARDWLRKGNNVGIAALKEDPLVIIDIDDENVTDYKSLKPTLTARSASRKGVHLFHFEDIVGSIPNIPTQDFGEIRAENQYVIAVGSYVTGYPDKGEKVGQYTIEEARPAEKIVFSEIPQVFKDQWGKVKKDDNTVNERKDKREGKKTDGKKSALFDLTVYDIVGHTHDPNERFSSIFHASKTGKNTSINNGLIHCFRHQVTLNALQSLCVLSDYLSCQEAGTGKKGSNAGQSLIVGDPRAIFEAWRYAKEHDFIPKNDPIPLRALGYIATSEGFCEKGDIEDEWKIPIDAHNKALAYLENKKIVTGRDTQRKKTKKEEHKEKVENATAEMLAILHDKYQFITTEDTKTIYYYKDGVYEEAERLIEAEIEQHLGIANSRYFCNEIIGHLQRENYIDRDTINTDKTRIPLKNGLFNLDTFELEPFDKNARFAFRFPITYKRDAKCPNIEAWIIEILNEDSVDLLQEFCGYGFVPDFPLHKTLWLHGTGRNGKGAFMRLYLKLIGKNGSSVPLDQMSAGYRFALIRLKDSFCNVCSEPPSNNVFQTETFKKLTGGDEVEGEIKGVTDTVHFTSFARIFIMGNSYPQIEDNSDGFWNRMEIVKFPHSFTDKAIPSIERKKIIEDGGEEEALAGFFNWCMNGLKRLKEHEYRITQTKTSNETRLEFEKVSNSVKAFISECITTKQGERYPQPALWNRYLDYCEDLALESQHKGDLTKAVGEIRGITLGKANINKKTQTVWNGLVFTEYGEGMVEPTNPVVEKQQQIIKVAKVAIVAKSSNHDQLGEKVIKDDKEIDINLLGGDGAHGNFDNFSNPKNTGLKCVCGKRFNTEAVLWGHQAKCKEFQEKQDQEAGMK